MMKNERKFEVGLLVVHTEDFTVTLGKQVVFFLDHAPSVQEIASQLPWGEVVVGALTPTTTSSSPPVTGAM